MGKKNDRRSRSKSHEKSSNWRPKDDSPEEPDDKHDASSGDEEEGEEGFMGTLSVKERAELEEKKVIFVGFDPDGGNSSVKAAAKQYAKAKIEKDQRDQWEQNQKWGAIRSKRAVVTASAREERVMKENYAVYTGEEGEENYIEGEEAGWYYCRLCSKKSATFEMLETHIGSKLHAQRVTCPEWYVADAVPGKGTSPSTCASGSAIASSGDIYATAVARGKEGEVASDGSKILARGDVARGWPQYVCSCDNGWWCELCNSAMICAEASLEAHLLGQKHQKNCDGNKLPRYQPNGGAEQAQIKFDVDGHLGQKKSTWPPYIGIVDNGQYKEWKCGLCNTTHWSDDCVDDHLISKRHQKNIVAGTGFHERIRVKHPLGRPVPGPRQPQQVPLPPGGQRIAPRVAIPPGAPSCTVGGVRPAGVPGSVWNRDQAASMGHQPMPAPVPPMKKDMGLTQEEALREEKDLLEKFMYVTDGELICQLCCEDLTRMAEQGVYTTGGQFKKHCESKDHLKHVLALTQAHVDYYQLLCDTTGHRRIYGLNHRTGELVMDSYFMQEPRKLVEMPKALSLIHGVPELPEGMIMCKFVPKAFEGYDYYEHNPAGKVKMDAWRKNQDKRVPWLQKVQLCAHEELCKPVWGDGALTPAPQAFFLFAIGVIFLLTGLKVFWQISTWESLPFTVLGHPCGHDAMLIRVNGRTDVVPVKYERIEVPFPNSSIVYRSGNVGRDGDGSQSNVNEHSVFPTTMREAPVRRVIANGDPEGMPSNLPCLSPRPSTATLNGVPHLSLPLESEPHKGYLSPPAPYPIWSARQPTVMRRTVSVGGAAFSKVPQPKPSLCPLSKLAQAQKKDEKPSIPSERGIAPPATSRVPLPSHHGRIRYSASGLLPSVASAPLHHPSMVYVPSTTSLVGGPTVDRLSSMEKVVRPRKPSLVQPTPREAGYTNHGMFESSSGSLSVHLESSLHESSQKITPSELTFGQELGAGEFGQVFRGSYKGKDVAIKKLFYDASWMTSSRHNEQVVRDLVREVESFRHLDHPGLVKFLGACLELPHLCLVTEYMPGGNLHQLLHVRRVRLTPAQRLKMSTQLTDAVAYLHAQKPVIVHRDLKTMNVVLDRGMNAKLCDFGLTEPMEFTHITRKSNGGSPRYMAPELFDERLRITERVDIWSLGCILIELFGGPQPYEGCDSLKELLKIMLVERRIPYVPPAIPAEVQRLIKSCLIFHAAKRPRAQALHERFKMLPSTFLYIMASEASCMACPFSASTLVHNWYEERLANEEAPQPKFGEKNLRKPESEISSVVHDRLHVLTRIGRMKQRDTSGTLLLDPRWRLFTSEQSDRFRPPPATSGAQAIEAPLINDETILELLYNERRQVPEDGVIPRFKPTEQHGYRSWDTTSGVAYTIPGPVEDIPLNSRSGNDRPAGISVLDEANAPRGLKVGCLTGERYIPISLEDGDVSAACLSTAVQSTEGTWLPGPDPGLSFVDDYGGMCCIVSVEYNIRKLH
ncbi:Mitogen-activated protein kinase kinase kinase 7 [Perkinsus chesapeaki]|uniref:Mitogen-activated protein kinase kinase kinase 7 n=1 Tax=Perkinsus chesapeaki TaxID=330153 RepID=A0A7J6M5H1_PERCH|nr:Mitogen-activated protein kinase kinase kinase 7 [Perkinsus chesapeaki]